MDNSKLNFINLSFDFGKLTINPESSIMNGLKRTKAGVHRLTAKDDEQKLVGILSNRDLRILSSKELKELKVIVVCTKENLVVVPEGTDRVKALLVLKKYKINSLPVLNNKGKLIGIITLDKALKHNSLCIVILPFKSPYLNTLEDHIKTPIEKELPVVVRKVDDISKFEPVIETIQNLIANSEILIPDVKERN